MKRKITAIVLVCALLTVGLTNALSMLALASQNDSSALVWRVDPTLPHDSITFCGSCGFMDEKWQLIDPATGRNTGFNRGGHGMGRPFVLVYDPVLNLLGEPAQYIGYVGADGMFPFDEALERLSWMISGNMHAVEIVDSTHRRYGETWDFGDGEPWQEWWLTEDALSGNVAVMYDGVFVTDFIFTGGGEFRFDHDVMPMRKNGGWGLVDSEGNATTQFIFDHIYVIDNNRALASENNLHGMIDRNGNVLVPFVFDHVLFIDEETVFAKYDGRYGILDVQATALAAQQRPEPLPNEQPHETPQPQDTLPPPPRPDFTPGTRNVLVEFLSSC